MRVPIRFALVSAAGLFAGWPVTSLRADAPVRSVAPGALLTREAPGQPWRFVNPGDALPAGRLLLGAPGAALDSANGAVRLTFISDLDQTSPFPVLETAVVPQEPGDADLGLILDRGRIDLTNRKAEGSARVRLTVRGLTGTIELKSPGARVAVEVYGRWPQGVPFTKDPKPGEGPALAAAVLALHGGVTLTGPRGQFTLSTPPGPALLMADDVEGFEPHVRHLDATPDWANPDRSERSKQVRTAVERFRKLAHERSIDAALEALLKSDDAAERRLGVVLCGALDELPKLGQALQSTAHQDVWESAVQVLRNWIGRAPGQDQILYRALIEKGGYRPAEAETVLQLLHSFADADLARPATYEMLLDYLDSDRLALRGLAHWHLARLVPEGAAIGYDPLAPRAERDRAARRWRDLIPKGQVPARRGAGS